MVCRCTPQVLNHKLIRLVCRYRLVVTVFGHLLTRSGSSRLDVVSKVFPGFLMHVDCIFLFSVCLLDSAERNHLNILYSIIRVKGAILLTQICCHFLECSTV
jgi:hypothetical protein